MYIADANEAMTKSKKSNKQLLSKAVACLRTLVAEELQELPISQILKKLKPREEKKNKKLNKRKANLIQGLSVGEEMDK